MDQTFCGFGEDPAQHCEPPTPYSTIRRVRTLGRGEVGEEALPGTILRGGVGSRTVRCEEGHVMEARIVREMRQFLRCGLYRCCKLICENCQDAIDEVNDAYYKCAECHTLYCTYCARESLNLPNELYSDSPRYRQLLPLLPGDVLLCGPTSFGIHHVVLVRSEVTPAPWMFEWLQPEPGLEIFQCSTIESTQSQKGEETWWYPATCYFQRDPYSGEAALIGDAPPESETVYCVEEPVPMKVLLHPLRPGLGRPELNRQVFESVVEELANQSKRYAWSTAIRAWLNSNVTCVKRSAVSEPGAHVELASADVGKFLQQLYHTWEAPPICATVAIIVWQKYFECVGTSPEEVAESIKRWMPCWCNATTPSKMVTTLTKCDWSLRLKFDAFGM